MASSPNWRCHFATRKSGSEQRVASGWSLADEIERGFLAQGAAKDGVDQATRPRLGQFHGLENGRVLRGLDQEHLVEAETQEVARVVVYSVGPQLRDPEVEQREIAQNPVKQLGGESTIGGA